MAEAVTSCPAFGVGWEGGSAGVQSWPGHRLP